MPGKDKISGISLVLDFKNDDVTCKPRIACNRSFCRRLKACTSGARNDHVSSLNCDRRFRFFKAASYAILLFALENVSCFFFF